MGSIRVCWKTNNGTSMIRVSTLMPSNCWWKERILCASWDSLGGV
jgi:hypothetical protein